MKSHEDPAGGLQPVERLEVQVLVDNVTDGLSTNPEHVHSEMRSLVMNGMEVISGEAICCAHHGLSLVIKASTGKNAQTMLFDAGPESYAVTRNGANLKIDFGAIGAMMLSHGHWDHAGGMLEAARLIRANRAEGALPCYLNAEMFNQRGVQFDNGHVLPMADVPKPEEYQAVGVEPIVNSSAQLALGGQFYVSGEIPRVTPYEVGLPGHVAREGKEAPWEADPLIIDERFLAVHVQGKGMVVFTACSHAGLINTLTESRARFPDIPLHAVVGGFHLSGPNNQKIIPETVRDLAGFEPKWIVPSHCTGWRAVHALVEAFGEDRVVPNAVGKKIHF